MSTSVVLCTYTVQLAPPPPSAVSASSDAGNSAAQCGALRVVVSGQKLTLRDVAAAWPFEGAFHFRAQLSPPNEPHVFLDLTEGPSMFVPLLADGSASLRALPLCALGQSMRVSGVDGGAWAWSAEEYNAWGIERVKRSAAAAAAASQTLTQSLTAETAAVTASDDSGGGGDDDSPWGADSGREGLDAEGRVREAAAAASAATTAALKSAGAAAGAAMSSMTNLFGRAAAAVKQRMA